MTPQQKMEKAKALIDALEKSGITNPDRQETFIQALQDILREDASRATMAILGQAYDLTAVLNPRPGQSKQFSNRRKNRVSIRP